MNSQAMRELDLVTLRQDLADVGLEAGDVGTVVFVHGDGEAYEVEFVAADGRTIAVKTLPSNAVSPVSGLYILHARKLTSV